MRQVGYAAGFAQQTSFGPGNVEVFFPWPGGGVGQYWYDQNVKKWNGPVVFGEGHVMSSVSWHEGDFATHDNGDHYNFEMVTVEAGHAVHWWRENQAPFTWHRNRVIPQAPDSVICAVIGRHHDNFTRDPLDTTTWHYHETTQTYGPLTNGGIHGYSGNGEDWRGYSMAIRPGFRQRGRASTGI